MDVFFSTLTLSFSPQILFAILGGTLGAFISSDRKRFGWQLSFMFILAAIAASAAMGEYLYLKRGISSIFWLLLLNIPLGMIVGSTLDVIRIANRPLIEKLINGIGNSGVNIVVESVLGKLSRWFGVKIPEDYLEGSKPVNDDKDIKNKKYKQ